MGRKFKDDELIKIGEKTFTKQSLILFDKVLYEIKQGELPLYKCCEKHKLNNGIFYDILNNSKEKENEVARARESFFNKKIEKIIEISERTDLTPEDRKIRIWAIERAAQLSLPKRYRDKIDTQINIQNNGEVIRFEIPNDNREKG